MIGQFLLAGAVAVLASSASAVAIEVAAPVPAARQFAFEIEAQRRCPSDTVVWVEAVLRIYNLEGERWYGRTRGGAFMCLLEASMAGFRPARR